MDHLTARGKVCILCFRKGDIPVAGSKLQQIIQEYVLEHFNTTDERLPTSVCGSCKTSLYSIARGSNKVIFPRLHFAKGILDSHNLRATCRAALCDSECLICQVARARRQDAKDVKSVIKRGRPKAKEEERSFRLCSNCFSPLYSGCKHECTAKTKLKVMTAKTSQTEKEIFACKVLRGKCSEGKTNTTVLSTGGRKVEASIGTQSSSSELQLSHSDMKKIQVHTGITQNQTLKLAEDLRFVSKNRKLIQPGLKQFLSENNLLFEDLFTIVEVNGVEGVFCNNVDELVRRISEKRGHDDEEPELFKLGVDSGRSSLKASISVLFADDEKPAKQRRTYEGGIDSAPKFQDNGVKKLLLLAVLPKTSEDYESLNSFLTSLNLPAGKYLLCADLKVNNCAVGLMSHSSRYPCCYCHWEKGSVEQGAEMRTFEGIREWNRKWVAAGRNPGKLKHFFNCRNVPIEIFPDEGRVIDFVPLSELHLLLGIVNKLFTEMQLVFPEALQWAQRLHLVKEEYHGQFEGNECHNLIHHTNVLHELILEKCQDGRIDNHPAAAFLRAFEFMGNMVQSCFGMSLGADWQNDVSKFCEAYMSLSISLTPKFHIVRDHLIDFCEEHKCGLGRFSEQSFEAVHADFFKCWERHLVKDKNSKAFSQRLLQTVREYNASHV